MTIATEAYAVTLQQLGGTNRLSAMVGAHNFVFSDEGRTIQFWFRGSRKVNIVRITLDTSDTYTVEFHKYNRKSLDCSLVASFEGVYADALKDIFETTTGLYLSL